MLREEDLGSHYFKFKLHLMMTRGRREIYYYYISPSIPYNSSNIWKSWHHEWRGMLHELPSLEACIMERCWICAIHACLPQGASILHLFLRFIFGPLYLHVMFCNRMAWRMTWKTPYIHFLHCTRVRCWAQLVDLGYRVPLCVCLDRRFQIKSHPFALSSNCSHRNQVSFAAHSTFFALSRNVGIPPK